MNFLYNQLANIELNTLHNRTNEHHPAKGHIDLISWRYDMAANNR